MGASEERGNPYLCVGAADWATWVAIFFSEIVPSPGRDSSNFFLQRRRECGTIYNFLCVHLQYGPEKLVYIKQPPLKFSGVK